ncbi:hypothetical protein CC86DRAFT_140790 [Ophiobolus disseminans]|uniref:Uncharacterized protein n=1 Tax=Ophiobolus disseminans TaxID=1469910 RepID=A0A6A7AEA5_9PLEO|nr:hypothetical protein CC86DRAFT_140790 [Ophiobolus disseminans]
MSISPCTFPTNRSQPKLSLQFRTDNMATATLLSSLQDFNLGPEPDLLAHQSLYTFAITITRVLIGVHLLQSICHWQIYSMAPYIDFVLAILCYAYTLIIGWDTAPVVWVLVLVNISIILKMYGNHRLGREWNIFLQTQARLYFLEKKLFETRKPKSRADMVGLTMEMLVEDGKKETK